MSLMASFVDGKLETQTASSNSLKDTKKNASGMDSDAFLQLLVAEMQNQDPLEPTSNTDWVAQYATFTQVSEIQQIGNDMSNLNAKSLVGENVIMKVTDSTGNTDFVSGKVDYVVYEEGKAYLSINDALYSIDDLDTVASTEYMEAYDLAKDIAARLSKLPNVGLVSLEEKDAIEGIYKDAYGMNDYQKAFLDKSVFDKIDEYYNKIKALSASVADDTKDGNDKGTDAVSSDN